MKLYAKFMLLYSIARSNLQGVEKNTAVPIL